MLLTVLAAATAFATPNVRLQDARYMLSRLPSRFDAEEKWTSADLRMFVDPNGRVLECTVVQVAGDEEVAQKMCEVFEGRRIKPARSFDGHPAYGLTVIRMGFHHSPSEPPPDLGALYSEKLLLSVDRLPSTEAGEPINSYPIGLLVGPDANVAACGALEDLPESVAEIGCAQTTDEPFGVMRDSQGTAVPYVRKLNVVFELADAQPQIEGAP